MPPSAKLAELKQKASECDCKIWRIYHGSEGYSIRAERNIKIADSGYLEDAQFIAAADPATVLAMVEEIERLRAAQCWVIMRKDNRDQVFDGPFFTEEDARLHVLDSVDHEYTVEPLPVKTSSASTKSRTASAPPFSSKLSMAPGPAC